MTANTADRKVQAIVLAAVDAIHELGLDRAKLTDVARKAGVTTGAVTYYFADKDAVLAAAFDETCRRMLAPLEARGAAWELERIFALLPGDGERLKDWAVWFAFCGRATADSTLRSGVVAHKLRLEEAMLRVMNADDSALTRHKVRTVLTAAEGIALSTLMHPGTWPEARQQQTLRAMVGKMFVEFQGGA